MSEDAQLALLAIASGAAATLAKVLPVIRLGVIPSSEAMDFLLELQRTELAFRDFGVRLQIAQVHEVLTRSANPPQTTTPQPDQLFPGCL